MTDVTTSTSTWPGFALQTESESPWTRERPPRSKVQIGRMFVCVRDVWLYAMFVCVQDAYLADERD